MVNETKLEKEIEHAKQTAHHKAEEAHKKATEYYEKAQKKMVEANEEMLNADEKMKENLKYKEMEQKLNDIEEQIRQDRKDFHDDGTFGEKVISAFHEVKEKLVRRNSHDQADSPMHHEKVITASTPIQAVPMSKK